MLPDLTADLLPDLEDPKECLRRAETCEQMARRKTVGKERSMLLELANRWRDMAQELERGFGPSKNPKKARAQPSP